MATEHSTITDPEIHEPKGIATAAAGKAYVANGAGSGEWQAVQRASYSCMKCVTTGATTGMTTAYQAVNNANLGGTCTWTTNTKSDDITHDLTSGFFTVTDAGVYNISTSVNFIPAAADTYYFTIGVDSGAGIVDKSSGVVAEITVTSSAVGDTRNVSFTCLPSLIAADDVYVMAKSAAGSEITISHMNFVMIRAT